MRVFVKNMRGQALMPCSPRKARVLVRDGLAKVIGYKPYTIQLLYATGETVQEVSIGVDTGAKHIGIGVTSDDKVLHKGEITLRDDIKSNLDARRVYRRNRRNRKTRYRKCRFLNRKREEGWLPPSLQSRLDHTFHWIDRFSGLVPNLKIRIEVGKFDTAKMINPEIQGREYQNGSCAGYYDVRYYVFARDEYTCQVCKKKNKILHTHHILYRSCGGTDRADNLISVCDDCHTGENHKPGGVLYDWMLKARKVKQYKEPPFMNILRRRIFKTYPESIITYGSETMPKRKSLGLEKIHYNDAIVISGISNIRKDTDVWFEFRQFRKKKRSLHEANPRKGRRSPNVYAVRNAKNTKEHKGWYLNDKVSLLGKVGWICGFTSGGCYVKDSHGEYITLPEKSYKQVGLGYLKFICHNNTWQYAIHPIS